MNSYERFMTALSRQEPDRVPVWELIINRPVIDALRGDVSYADFVELEDIDGITVFEDQHLTEIGAGNRVCDEWGIVWGIGQAGIPYPEHGPIESASDLKGFQPPDPDEDFRLATLREAVRRFKGERAIVFLTHDGFEYPAYLYGMENLLVAYLTEPEVAHNLARMCVEYKMRLMEHAIEEGADVIVSGDDYASRKGPLMSPDHFREFIAPYLAQSVELAHAHGTPYIKHTDGYLWPILDMLVETGIDAIDPIEPIARMDIGEVKAKYGGRVAVVGNIDCTKVLPLGTPEDVREAVKETIAKASPGGGHILASSNSIHPAVKPENYKAMLDAAREFGTYPLDPQMVETYRKKSYIAALLDYT